MPPSHPFRDGENEPLTVWQCSRRWQKLEGTEQDSLVKYEYASFTIQHLQEFQRSMCVCVWIRQMHSTQCHMWNRHKNTKDLHAWPLLLEACQLGPKALYSPEGFIRLHHFACSYCTLSTPLVETKQTLETTMKTPRENKLPLKVIFSLSPLIQLCVSHPKIVALALWSEYVAVECTIHGMIFSLTCLCMFSHSCVRVHQLSLLSWRCRVR